MLNNNLGGEIVDHLSFPLCTVWYEKKVYHLRMKTTKCPRRAEGLRQVSCQAVLSTAEQVHRPLLNHVPQSRIQDGQGAGPWGPSLRVRSRRVPRSPPREAGETQGTVLSPSCPRSSSCRALERLAPLPTTPLFSVRQFKRTQM